MTLQSFYDEIGGDYEGVFDRIGDDELILKYLKKFKDSDPLEQFRRSVDDGDCKEAFRHMHSLKGLCLNLGFTKLFGSVDELCEELRGKEEIELQDEPMEEAEESYGEILDLVEEIVV
ncbi:MAG: Hpt domain-containing protein [Lachnospiraceae bacterium]|nr:Hpt domain-containing protein [Lachnospiraceae bacterium]